jgi:hypothetical protein
MAEIDALRAQSASQIQLQAYDLIDELVFGWTQHPVFAVDTPVILADVTVPLDLGTGLQALIENHIAALMIAHPGTRMTLVHCPQCMSILVHSGATGTVISRGVDAPDALARTGAASDTRHALFLDFEAEGSSLVLRARITRLTLDLPIVYAQTLSSSTSSAALLRTGDHLVSAEQARKEFLDDLEGRGILLVPLRLVVRSYQPGSGSAVIGPVGIPTGVGVSEAPWVWLETGVEVALTHTRAWTAGLSLGYSWAPSLHDGWLAEARVSRLLTGSIHSLTRPDLYAYFGTAAINVHGPDALLFSQNVVDTSAILAAQNGTRPQTTFVAWQIGLELRIKNRIGASVFMESIPGLQNTPNLGNYFDPFGIVAFQTLGGEIDFWF